MISEIFEAIENAAGEIKVDDPLSGRLEPVEVLWKVARFHGNLWEKLTEQFERGEISPDFYRDCAIALIKEFAFYQFNRNVEKKLIAMGGK